MPTGVQSNQFGTAGTLIDSNGVGISVALAVCTTVHVDPDAVGLVRELIEDHGPGLRVA